MNTTEQLKGLREKAEAATPGPWAARIVSYETREVRCCDERECPIVKWTGFDDCDRSHGKHNSNAIFIATADPSLIKRMVDLIEAWVRYDDLRIEGDMTHTGAIERAEAHDRARSLYDNLFDGSEG